MATSKEDIGKLFAETKKSLVAFTNAFLITNPLKPAQFHYWLADNLINSKKNMAVEGFRESAKTTYVVYGVPLYWLVFPRADSSYIVLLKASDDLAKSKLHDLRDIYFSNKMLSANIQKVYQQGDSIDVLTKEGVRVRIEAYGKGANIRGLTWMGKRPDIVIMDDIQSVEDTRSLVVADRDWEWFLSDVYMLSKESRVFMIGNNLGDRCVIERLSRNAEDFGFEFHRVPVIKDGKSLWAEKFSIQELMRERDAYAKTDKLDIWMRERMCVSMAEETRIFKKAYFQYYDNLPKYGAYNKFISVDLAVSQKTTADYSALCCLAINDQQQRFIEDIVYGRFNLDDLMDRLFDMVREHNPVKVIIEKVAFQAVVEQVVRKEMLKRNVFFNVEMVQPKGRKEDRIKSLQPYYGARTVWHKRDADYLAELEQELIMFAETGARTEHDDLIDSLEMANRYGFSPMTGGMNGELQREAKFI